MIKNYKENLKRVCKEANQEELRNKELQIELQAEKEKNKSLKKQMKLMQNCDLSKEIEKQQKEIENLQNKVMEQDSMITGLKEDRRIAVEEIQEQYYISKDKITDEIFHYNKNALDIEQNNMFRPATSKEQIEIDINRAIAQAMQKLLKE